MSKIIIPANYTPALNLYDDMYSWLAARGEADIDEALSHNKGYQEYREAVGK